MRFVADSSKMDKAEKLILAGLKDFWRESSKGEPFEGATEDRAKKVANCVAKGIAIIYRKKLEDK